MVVSLSEVRYFSFCVRLISKAKTYWVQILTRQRQLWGSAYSLLVSKKIITRGQCVFFTHVSVHTSQLLERQNETPVGRNGHCRSHCAFAFARELLRCRLIALNHDHPCSKELRYKDECRTRQLCCHYSAWCSARRVKFRQVSGSLERGTSVLYRGICGQSLTPLHLGESRRRSGFLQNWLQRSPVNTSWLELNVRLHKNSEPRTEMNMCL